MADHSHYYDIPDGKYKEDRYKHYFSRYINPFFPADKNVRILDLGCGYGIFLDACRRGGYRNLFGVEIEKKWADYGREKLDLKNLFCGDIFTYLSFQKDSSFDIITVINVMEHIKKDRVHELFNHIFNKLTPGGFFLAEMPNADSPHGLSILFSDLTHEWAYTRRLLNQLFKIHGFVNWQILPSDVRSNRLVRLAQKIVTKIFSGDDRFMYASNLICIAYKPK